MTQTVMPFAEAKVDGAAVEVTAGRITLDEAWSPYGVGTVTVPLSGVDVASLDARDTRRVQVSLTDLVLPDPTPRLFDLALRGRRIDHKARTVDVDVATDEALLFDTARLATTPNTGARAFESSLRGICDWALGQVPGVLRNLEPNPGALGGVNNDPYGSRFGWAGMFTAAAPQPTSDLFSVARFTSTETGSVTERGVDSYGNSDAATPGSSGVWSSSPTVTPSETITISRYVRMNLPSGTIPSYAVRARFHDAAGNWVGSTVVGSSVVADSSSAWARPSLTVTVPAGAKRVAISVRPVGSIPVTTSTFIEVTGLMTAQTGRLGLWREKSLLSGPHDADMTAQWDATNLLLNPDAITAADWAASTNTTILAAGGSIRATPTGSGATYVHATRNPTNIPCSPGDLHTGSFYVTPDNAGQALARIRYYDASGAVISEASGPTINVVPAQPSRPYVTAVAPANASTLTMLCVVAGGPSNIDKAMLTEGPLLLDYFSGNTTDTANYTYSFDGPTNGAASLRVATPERLPALFDWKPGQNLWDFLRPFLESAGLRLFCDELRDWRVITTADYTPPVSGAVVATATGEFVGNTTAATDTISRDRTDWATGVVVRFQWRDQAGINREAFDVAGTPGKVITLDRNTAPLPGAAATILDRISARGASQDLTVIADFSATPGGSASVSMIDTPDQTGRISRVSFDLHSGLIDFTTRDMEDS